VVVHGVVPRSRHVSTGSGVSRLGAGEGAGAPRMTRLRSRSATLAGCDRFPCLFTAWCIGRGTYPQEVVHPDWGPARAPAFPGLRAGEVVG